MEAVPKLPMIEFELKTSPEQTHFGPKLKQFISANYREDPESYSNECHQLECLRSAAVRASVDDAGLAALTKYYCQLRRLKTRFPMGKGQPASVSFSWKDLHANMTCSSNDISFEMACIVYNIGAMHTILGASEPRTSQDSLKAACTHYQHAAWAFQQVGEQYAQPSGLDISSENMKLYAEICFAQAQECILEKSILDSKKPSVVGSVGTQVLHYYKNCLAILGPSTGTDNIHEVIGTKYYNYLYRNLSFKSSYIGCIVSLYQGMQAEEQQKMGERVGYYQLALDRLNEARKLVKYIEPTKTAQDALNFTHDVVEGKRKGAKNENEFIYHEEVPDKDLLVEMKPVSLAKAVAINLDDPNVSGQDIFARLIPIGAHEQASLYSEEKAKLLRSVMGRAELKNTEFTEFMSSLQLDQLDVLETEQTIPQDIVDRCAAMNAKSDIIQVLVDTMNGLAEIISEVEHSLEESKIMIHEEITKEKEFQKIVGPRPPSIVQTDLSREYNKYQDAHAKTNESNQVLHKAMTLHIANLRLLALPLEQLESKIPCIENIEGLDRDAMAEMKRVVSKAREMQTQRDHLIQSLIEDMNNDDITSSLLYDGQHPDELFSKAIEKHKPKIVIIDQNLSAQENIINKLTSLYASYGESRRLLTDVLRKRDALIHALITSYDTYKELLGKSHKGLEFYKKLLNNLNQLNARLKSTCQVQAEEREQLLSKQSKATPSIPSSFKQDVPAPVSTSTTPKLKDYLPYMKNRGAARDMTMNPSMRPDAIPNDMYYPEGIYPTSIRPTPVGSEAAPDATQLKYPDGYIAPQDPNQYYNQYAQPTSDSAPYNPQNNYTYPMTNKSSASSDVDPYGYTYGQNYYTNYNAPKDLSVPEAKPYSYNVPTSSQMPNTSGYYDPYTNQQMPETSRAYENKDLNTSFAQMHVSQPQNQPKPDMYNPNANIDYPSMKTSIPQDMGQNMPHNQNMMPNNPNMMPNHPNMMPNNPNMMPNNPNMMPNNPNMMPNNPNMMPNNPNMTQNPNLMANNPNLMANNPNMVANNTNMPANNPNIMANNPNMMQKNQNIPSSTPDVIPNNQNTPNNPYQNPNNPNFGSDYHTYSMQYQYQSPLNQYDTSITSEYNKTHLNLGINNTQTFNPISSNYSIESQPSIDSQNIVYTNAGTPSTYSVSTVSSIPSNLDPAYTFSSNAIDPNLSQIDAFDAPIKSHAKGEALSYYNQYEATPPIQNVPQTYPTVSTPYDGNYQNHPGYTFNQATGAYEYSYGSQNTFATENNPNSIEMAQNNGKNWPGVYTSAGTYETVQSPSEVKQGLNEDESKYYNNPYGYQTVQPNDMNPQNQDMSTNYGANVNQSTYMQSIHGQNTSVTFTENQVTSPVETMAEAPSFHQNVISPNEQNQEIYYNSQNNASLDNQTVATNQNIQEQQTKEDPKVPVTQEEISVPSKIETVAEVTNFDLLSDIDFNLEQPPLMPHINVPQISESALKKPDVTQPVQETVSVFKPVKKEPVLERPAKRDVFSQPSLLNDFTREVREYYRFVDSLTYKTPSGFTVLDAKWRSFLEVQSKENSTRTKDVAASISRVSILKDVVPYDDSRVVIKSRPDDFINASFYKQLTSWCIPLVISKCPEETDRHLFWKAVLENKVTCIVCLLGENEISSPYWPVGVNETVEYEGVRVRVEEKIRRGEWTERRLTVEGGGTVLAAYHYHLHVFPVKVVCAPLVQLADQILNVTYRDRVSNMLNTSWIHCSTGAGRSAVVALLLAVMSQLRAGQIHLCDILDEACANLYKHRTNVLEDTKYLADAYSAVLYYVQGVMCSGTTMFNGDAVSKLSGANITPPSPMQVTLDKEKETKAKTPKESFEEMKQSPGLKTTDLKDPLNFLDPLWSLKKK